MNAQPETSTELYQDGEIIFLEGSSGDLAYIVQSGEVEILRTQGDREVVLTKLGPGALFGEMTLLDGGQRSATARALGETQVQYVGQAELLNRLANDPDSAINVMKRMSANLRAANEQIVSVSLEASAEDVEEEEQPSWKDLLLPSRVSSTALIAEFQPDVVEIERRPVPALAMITLYTIIAFLVVMLAWMSFASFETVISSNGRVTSNVPNISIEVSEASVVRGIHVGVGEQIKKGDRLLTLDVTNTEADLHANQAQLMQLEAEIARLRAEFDDRKQLVDTTDPLQQALFRTRLSEHEVRISNFDGSLRNLGQALSSAKTDASLLREQLAITSELETARRELYEEEIGSLVSYLGTKNDRLRLERELANIERNVKSVQAEIDAKEGEKSSYLSARQAQIASELSVLSRERDVLREEEKKLRLRRDNIEVTAQTDGVVLNVADLSIGSMVSQGDLLVTLVPVDVPIEIAIDVNPKDISQIRVGDTANIKLEALPFQKHGNLEGQLNFISEDTLAMTLNGKEETVYRGRVIVTANHLTDVPENFRLINGMNTTVDIKVGERRLITYFLYPIARWLKTSFREP